MTRTILPVLQQHCFTIHWQLSDRLIPQMQVKQKAVISSYDGADLMRYAVNHEPPVY